MYLRKFISFILAIPFLAALIFVAVGIYRGGTAINHLLTENKKLKEALTNLTDAGKIGYAKVIAQTYDENGKVVLTELKFVETARDDELNKILEKNYTIEGDIVHFDALIVKFGNKAVMNGEKKSLYLWRRIYGENTAPGEGYSIEEQGKEPERYKELLKELSLKQREVFWENIWDLANDPQKLRKYDIEAIFGNVTYVKLRKGLLYVFKISPTGQVYPEVIPEL